MTASIYLDNNATTRILPEVVEVMTDCLQQGYLNPASQHRSGRAARRVLEAAREQIGSLLGASLNAPHQDQIIFTSGGTESNNLAIRGLVRQPGEVLISGIEHPSALAAADELVQLGCQIVPIPIRPSGHIDPGDFAGLLNDDTRLAVVMLGNNEVGTLQPVGELASLCDARDIPMHCDCVQVVGKMPVHFRELGVCSLAFSAHKFHGPRGIGGLIVRNNVSLQPLIVGGSQQLGIRPGTESIAAVVGMVKALELFCAEQDTRAERTQMLRDELENRLIQSAGATVNGCEPRMPHTTNVSFPGLDRQQLIMALDLAGVECSTGSACTSGSSEPSHVLLAMGCADEVVESSIRLSVSALTSRADITLAVERILSVAKNLGAAK